MTDEEIKELAEMQGVAVFADGWCRMTEEGLFAFASAIESLANLASGKAVDTLGNVHTVDVIDLTQPTPPQASADRTIYRDSEQYWRRKFLAEQQLRMEYQAELDCAMPDKPQASADDVRFLTCVIHQARQRWQNEWVLTPEQVIEKAKDLFAAERASTDTKGKT